MVKSASTTHAATSTPSAGAAAATSALRSQPVPTSYEAALTELEKLVGAMEGSQLPLDELLGAYQRGADLLDFCRARLDAVEQQVKRLEDGQLQAWSDK
jgi:exodeoxyribonuclease VII small subunit